MLAGCRIYAWTVALGPQSTRDDRVSAILPIGSSMSDLFFTEFYLQHDVIRVICVNAWPLVENFSKIILTTKFGDLIEFLLSLISGDDHNNNIMIRTSFSLDLLWMLK